MNVNVNPFSYNTNDTSSYNYKRLDPSPFWNPSIHHLQRAKKKKFKNDEGVKKVVRNVKTLPEHLIGRFKHREVSKKSKVLTNHIVEDTIYEQFCFARMLSILAAGVMELLSGQNPAE